MAKLINMKKRPARSGIGRPRPGHASVRGRGSARGMRGRRYNWLWSFVRRNYKLISIGAAVVAAGVVCLIVFSGGANRAASGEAAAASLTPAVSPAFSVPPDETYDYSNVDESVLAGLTGSDDSLFSDDEELADTLFAKEGLRIGVTIGKLSSAEHEQILSCLEEAANAAEGQKLVYEVYYYNADGNYNQQVQDVRSLLKNGVDAIVTGFCDQTSFSMVTMMAKEEGVPVVAIGAPVKTGYAVSVAADESAWGQVYGAFMAQNLTEGNVAAIFSAKDDPADTARLNAALGELAKNQELAATGTVYAAGKKADAKTAMVALLAAGEVDGVITEDGMAEGILDAYIEAGKLPKVMCADVTAGFIKKWYALKNGGLRITPKTDSKKKDEPAPTPVLLLAQPDELVVCAQPSNAGMGAAAFEFALRLAEGRTLKSEGQTFEYKVNTLITEDNLGTFYEQVKDEDADFSIRDFIVTSEIEALFEAAETEQS